MLIKLPNPLYSVTFDASEGTITIAGLGNVISADVNRVINVTADDLEIFGDATKRGGTITKSVDPDQLVLSLDYDASAMADTDVIEVILDVNPEELLIDATSSTTGGGGGGGGGGGAITSVDLGVKADSAASSDTGTFSLIALFKRMLQKLTSGVLVFPQMASGDNVALQTAATGNNWTAFADQACKQLTLSNQTGTIIEVRQGSSATFGLQIPTGGFYTFFGITNTNQLGIRRADVSNTQVTITARWEA